MDDDAIPNADISTRKSKSRSRSRSNNNQVDNQNSNKKHSRSRSRSNHRLSDKPRCSTCLLDGHFTSECKETECRNCHKKGHIQKNCPDWKSGKVCYNCRMTGHISRYCKKNVEDSYRRSDRFVPDKLVEVKTDRREYDTGNRRNNNIGERRDYGNRDRRERNNSDQRDRRDMIREEKPGKKWEHDKHSWFESEEDRREKE